jgi:hypothetical protein
MYPKNGMCRPNPIATTSTRQARWVEIVEIMGKEMPVSCLAVITSHARKRWKEIRIDAKTDNRRFGKRSNPATNPIRLETTNANRSMPSNPNSANNPPIAFFLPIPGCSDD